MTMLAEAKMYARFASGLPSFLRETITLAHAEQIVRRRLERREDSFLRLLERGIFGNPRSPYRPLLRLAGCELGDVRAMLRSRGLEGTLVALRQTGVYVSFEEMKGRAPLVRDGREIPLRPRDFDNPFLSRAYHAESGGSTGAGSRVPTDLDHLAATAPHLMLGYAAHGVHAAPTVLWRGVLPDGSGIANVLRGARWGNVPRRWFSLVPNRDYRPPLRFRLATRGIVGLGRALDLILSGRTIDAAEALAIGLISRIAPKGGALALALEMAEQIAGSPWETVISDRKSVYMALGLSLEDALLRESQIGREASMSGVPRFVSGEGRHGAKTQ
jgi:hypothetical protein